MASPVSDIPGCAPGGLFTRRLVEYSDHPGFRAGFGRRVRVGNAGLARFLGAGPLPKEIMYG
jgi:hypothetical protein